MALKDELARNLKERRRVKGQTLVACARELGISKSTLQNIEKGHSSTLDTVDCIAKRLGVPAISLLSPAFQYELPVDVWVLKEVEWLYNMPCEKRDRLFELAAQMAEVIRDTEEGRG